MNSVVAHRSSARIAFGSVALLPILVLLALLIWLPPDGVERSGWAAFLGHFHPLAVHLPIAFVLLIPIMEWAGGRPHFAALHQAVPFVLAMALLGAIAAPLLGWLLAWSGGFSGPIVEQHMWGGVSIAVGCWLSWLLRGPDADIRSKLYWVALTITVLLVPLAGYRGGQLAHGEGHLSEHMPDSLRALLGVPAVAAGAGQLGANVDPSTFYGARIHPVLAARCVSCHGPNKHKGNLRLDSYAALMQGGTSGAVVKPRDPKGSELFRRVTLSHDDQDFMPAEGKRPLTADEVKLVELWITDGASATAAAGAIAGAPTSAAPVAVAEVRVEEIDPVAVEQERAQLKSAVAQLQRRYPYVLDYQSRGSGDLRLNAAILGKKFGDAQLADFAPVAGRIVLADLSGTSISDRSAALVGTMKQLRVLYLKDTQIGDRMLGAMSALNELRSLNVFGAPVTAASLPTLERLPKLEHVYVAETKIPRRISAPERLVPKLQF